MSVQNGMVMSKVEAVKELRIKTLRLEELKTAMVQEAKSCDQEENRIAEFKNEMEALLQDKMSHVEELRQIHSDINVRKFSVEEESKVDDISCNEITFDSTISSEHIQAQLQTSNENWREDTPVQKVNEVVVLPEHLRTKSALNIPVQKIKKLAEKYGLKRKMEDVCSILQATAQKSACKEKDICDIYGELVAIKLKSMDERSREICMHQMDNLLYKMKFRNKPPSHFHNQFNSYQHSPLNFSTYSSLSQHSSSQHSTSSDNSSSSASSRYSPFPRTPTTTIQSNALLQASEPTVDLQTSTIPTFQGNAPSYAMMHNALTSHWRPRHQKEKLDFIMSEKK